MSKRLMSGVLIIILVLCSFSVSFATDKGKKSGLFSYKLKGNGTAIITKYDWSGNNSYNPDPIYIPQMIDGYTVTEIGMGAFSYPNIDTLFNGLASSYFSSSKYGVTLGKRYFDTELLGGPTPVILPDTITVIDDFAFCATMITSIQIPASVQLIGSGAFAGCVNLQQFYVDSGNEVYATIKGALYNKREKELVAVPMGKFGIIREIEWNDDTPNCAEQKEPFVVPEGIVSIGDFAFYGLPLSCENGDIGVAIPSSVKSIGRGAFARTYIGSLKNNYFKDPANSPTLSFPSVEHIADNAFYNSYLNCIIDFPMVQDIGDSAFERSDFVPGSFNSFNFPASLKEIGESSFLYAYSRYSLEGKTVLLDFSNTQLREIPNKAFWGFGYGSMNTYVSVKNIMWPKSLQKIGDEAFYFVGFEDRIALNDGLLELGDKCFGNSRLELSIPASVTKIGVEIINRSTSKLLVEAGSFAELYAKENGVPYSTGVEDDTSWLTNDSTEEEDTSWLNN